MPPALAGGCVTFRLDADAASRSKVRFPPAEAGGFPSTVCVNTRLKVTLPPAKAGGISMTFENAGTAEPDEFSPAELVDYG